MAEDVVIARFRADLDQVRAEFDQYINTLEKVQKEEKDTQAETKKTATTAEQASKKRTQAIKAEEAELKRLSAARKNAFSVDEINGFNKKISETKDRIATLKGETAGVGSSIKSTFAGIGAGIAAAFSIQAVTQFAKASVDAFLEAEENANRLKFAITTIGGESEVAFQRLIDQSAQLQQITVFSDDSIQQAQAALSAFGLTADEIEKLIPKLADFATITSQDIPSAAQQIGVALEGNGREFKKYGIEVSAAASRTENLSSVLNGLVQFEGAAENATKTLTGGLKQAENQVGELQETIGSKLAPGLVAIKLAFLDFVDTIITSKQDVEDALKLENLKADTDKTISALDARAKKIEEVYKITPNDSYILALQQEIKLQEKLRDEASKSTLAKSADDYNRATAALELLNNELIDFNLQLKAQEAATDEQAARVLSIAELQKKTSEDLVKLAEKESEINDNASKKNIKNINDIIKAREAYAAEYAKNIELLKQLQIKAIDDEKQRRIAEFEDQVSKLTAQGELRAKIITEYEKQLVKDLNEIDQKRNVDPLFRAPQAATAKIPDTAATDASKADVTPVGNAAKLDEETTSAEVYAEAQTLVSDLISLYNSFAEQQIADINKVTNAQLEALSIREQAINDNLEKGRISEREAANQLIKIEAEKVAAKEAADKKIAAIKRKQFNIDKAAALVEISINLAQAVSKVIAQAGLPGVALSVAVAALIAAQGVAVAAQPNPYKKGTKSAKKGMALVGEEGPELMMLSGGEKIASAPRTKKYAKVFDAIQDDKFEDYVFRNFVTPELKKHKEQSKQREEKSLAANITKSMVVNNMTNGKGDFYLERISKAGLVIKNVDDLADAITRRNSISPYRR